MMANRSNRDRETLPYVTRKQRAGMFRNRSADTIKARGKTKPQTKAGHMTANHQTPSQKKSLHQKGRPHMTEERWRAMSPISRVRNVNLNRL